MIQTIYSEFDTDISVSVNKGKTFNESQVNWSELSKIDGIKSYSRAIEEIVVLRLKSIKKIKMANLRIY